MEPEIKLGKTFEGVVVKSAMKDTATVQVERYVKHPKYKKFMRLSKKFLVHDVGNVAQIGEKVTIRETRPISKRKRFVLVSRDTQVKSEE
ncbi:30S ribosomal protein S17 [Candidatus Kaiserbacteria bacterium RIFCSPHIGHO2_02_FULL_55_20]|uniref:Small ribosomal subunit protein uS17 n=1 Tax=Candidatus Kaiserbacteria bacterium RIFCSPHIGHO2_02_FULL_55_20 TaxID=1798497 RepID=A0A1F6DY88_9BACT|nr:MAG: 30S ribosomal protein S17 [Candidatus Kaiserbacteria bacterium RIFCSPHIGHO2_01_FULL_55_37]OGG65962.1 MAG: 30S ribosomal protein S17 [Candidatus Kaiserbacteria bacterium RIFCSPHIGHO2_02_FULL_55_20]